MRRKILVAAGGIGLLAAGSITLILVGSDPPSVVVGDLPAAPAEPPPLRGGAESPASAAPVAPVIVEAGPPVPVPEEGSWEAVTPVARLANLGPLGVAFSRALQQLRPAMSACYDEDAQARNGMQPPTEVTDYGRSEEVTLPSLMLQIETQSGSATIVDAPVSTRGGASDGLLTCVQRVVRGRTVQVPGTEAGGRYRALYPVVP